MRLLYTLLFIITTSLSVSAMPTRLRTNHLDKPLGVDDKHPRLSWQNAEYQQKAYRIIVGSDSVSVSQQKGDMWDSGKKEGDARMAEYEGKEIKPRTRYYWMVIAWDETSQMYKSEVTSFETGLLNEPWRGAWIGDHNNQNHFPAPYFRKSFNAQKAIKNARAYIAVAGLYKMTVNGKSVTETVLNPVYTRFDRRISYQTYDITPLLCQGENALGVVLGNGWYNHQALAVWDFERAPWRNRPAFCMDVYLTYDDGTTETVCTDLSWRTNAGGLKYNNIYTGEHFDFSLEPQNWDSPGFNDKDWHGVRYRQAPAREIWSQQMEPIVKAETISPKSLKQINDTVWVYDFGRNLAGITSINVKGEKGTCLRLIHGERLHESGLIDMGNIDIYYRGDKTKEPFQTDILTLSGNDDSYTTQFGYKGFRYVQVESSKPIKLAPENLTAYFVHSRADEAGCMSSSNEILNKIMEATRAAYLSNLMGFPTDCPQREKNGWTGDGHLAIETALYNYDAMTIYEKWMQDHRDEQQPNGVLPDIIPTDGWGYGTDNGLDWTSTICIIPWNLYLFYADKRPLKMCYENMKLYVDYVDRQSPGHLTSWGRGDWVPVKTRSTKEFTSSIYFFIDATILGKVARLLGHDADNARYEQLAHDIRKALNDKYLDRERGIYATGTQTEMSMALKWGIAPEDVAPLVASNLNDMVVANDFHLDVGVLGAKAILDALTLNGYAETAYRIATQTTYPSWGYWIVNGATTLQENWQIGGRWDSSDNHIMFGEIGAWPYKGLGGIYPDELQPGFRNVILRPNFVKGLDRFSVSHRSPYGEVKSEWQRKGRKVVYKVTIPAGATATLHLPQAKGMPSVQDLKAGVHEFTVRM